MSIQSKGVLKEANNTNFPNESAYDAGALRTVLNNIIDSYKDEVRTLTQAQIDAISSPQTKDLVYNSDLNELQVYLGAWLSILTARTGNRVDEFFYRFTVAFDGEAGSGAVGAIVLPELYVPSGFVCYQTVIKAVGFETGSEVIAFGVEVDATNNIFSMDLTTIDETRTFIINHTDTLTETTAQRKIVGSVSGGDVTQGTITVIAKFIGV